MHRRYLAFWRGLPHTTIWWVRLGVNAGRAYGRFMDTTTAVVLLAQLQVMGALVALVIYLVKNR